VLLEKLTQFITSLIENGNLGLARALRSQFILKYEERRTRLLPDFDLASMNSINRRCNLLNFKSTDLAEQMTLLGERSFCKVRRKHLATGTVLYRYIPVGTYFSCCLKKDFI